MKSKITLTILIVVIVFLGALSFFFGYKYLDSDEKINELTAQVESLNNEKQEIETQLGNKEGTDNVQNEVQSVEKLTIPKVDNSKIDASNSGLEVEEVLESGVSKSIDNTLSYIIGSKTSYSSSGVTNYDFQFRLNDKKYNFVGKQIVDVQIQSHGTATSAYIIVLLDDGTIQYALKNYDTTDLQFKEYDLKDVVRIMQVAVKTTNGRITSRVGAITSDGYTHILPYDMP